MALAGTASAGSFSVNPVRASLSAGQPVASLTVRNAGTEPTVVQLELVSWSQRDGKDVYTPTREVLATPPIFTLPAGGTQVIRVGMRRAPDAQRELSYRLFLHEVPPPPSAGLQGLRVALRISMPVFIAPPVDAAPALRWRAARTPRGELKLSLTNSGNAHVQVANFRLISAGRDLASQQVAAYVLPGQTQDWLLKAAVPPGTLRIVAQTDAGEVQSELIVAKP